MTLTVTHAKTVNIADDAKAAAAGEVLPSDWNANHVVSGVAFQVATSNLTLYVDPTGSDSNNGTSSLTPFATIQHAINVAQSYDFDGQYFPQINCADGSYNETIIISQFIYTGGSLYPNTVGTAWLRGNNTTPANCKIAPNGLNKTNIVTVQNRARIAITGFTLLGDSSFTRQQPMMQVQDNSFVILANMVWDASLNNSGLNPYENALEAQRWCQVGSISGTGGADDDVLGWKFNCPSFSLQDGVIVMRRWSLTNGPDSRIMTFSAANNSLLQVFALGAYSEMDLSSMTFVNPGNFTNSTPLDTTSFGGAYCNFTVGADPTTITWPGGAFDPTHIDDTSTIDGLFYAHQKSGLPATTDLYQGTYGFFKDTSGAGVYAAYNDAGTIKKVQLT